MSESTGFRTALVLAFLACASVMMLISFARIVAAEDDCAQPTLVVQRTPVGLVCFFEGEQ